MIPGYPKVHALGHAQIPDVLDGYVVVQEKIDGSQISWQFGDLGLQVRSKGKLQFGTGMEFTDKMFESAVDYLLTVVDKMKPNFIYRGEVLNSPKHNVLEYERTPKHGIVLYDIEMVDMPSGFLGDSWLESEANNLGLEVVPSLGELLGGVYDADDDMTLLGSTLTLEKINEVIENTPSLLGGKMEGLVIKNYNRFKLDGKVQMAKVVRAEFLEKHRGEWKARPTVLESLAASLNTEARWQKAVQYLRDNGELTGEDKDIGPLMRRVKKDILEEEMEYITDALIKDALSKLTRKLGRGLPEWYKEQLAEGAFDA